VASAKTQPESKYAVRVSRRGRGPSSVEEVVDELAAGGGLFLAYGEKPGAFVLLGEGVDDLLHGGARAAGGAGRTGPGRAGSGQMRADEGAQPVTGLGGLLAQGCGGRRSRPG
jgi:hypothetical protein